MRPKVKVGESLEWEIKAPSGPVELAAVQPPAPQSLPQVVEWDIAASSPPTPAPSLPDFDVALARRFVSEHFPKKGPLSVINPFSKAPRGSLTVLSYNLMNLLPAKEEGVFFMSREEKALDDKQSKLSQFIRKLNGGRGPDVLALTECGSETMTRGLRNEFLYEMGYSTVVHLNTRDPRGISPALISRHTLAHKTGIPTAIEPTLHEIRGPDTKVLRGVLQVDLDVDGELVTVFVNHWPSKLGKEAAARGRELAGATLRGIIASVLKVDPARKYLIAGDFNCEPSESPWGPTALGVSFSPEDTLAQRCPFSPRAFTHGRPVKMEGTGQVPEGTYFSEQEGRMVELDGILVSPAMLSGEGLVALPGSVVPVCSEDNARKMNRRNGNPSVWVPDKALSDHFPVYAQFPFIREKKGFWPW